MPPLPTSNFDPGPLKIDVARSSRPFEPGYNVSGRIHLDGTGEMVQSVDMRFFGLCKTEVLSGRSEDMLGSSSIGNTYHLFDQSGLSIFRGPTVCIGQSFPFSFKIPEYTDTIGKHKPPKAGIFATHRHRLPPSFLEKDALGNHAQIRYIIMATTAREEQGLEPYTAYEEVQVGIFGNELAAVPWFLKPVVKRSAPVSREHTLLEKLQDISCLGHSCCGPQISLRPTIYLPNRLVSGSTLPFKILLDLKRKGLPNISDTDLTLDYLSIILKEDTYVLTQMERDGWFGKSRKSIYDFSKRKVVIVEMASDFSKRVSLQQEDSRYTFESTYDIDERVMCHIQTFNIAKQHEIVVKAEVSCESKTFQFGLKVPVVVVQNRKAEAQDRDSGVFSEDTLVSHTPESFLSQCPTCRHTAAQSAAQVLLRSLPPITEWSRESLAEPQPRMSVSVM